MVMTHEEAFSKVQEVLVDALGVDEDEVAPNAKLVADLGAESIDFLDIVFRLEKAFGVKVDQRELTQDDVLNDSNYVIDGRVTDKGMQELRNRLPHADLDVFDKSRDVNDFSNIFTVDVIVNFVRAKLSQQEKEAVSD